MVSESEQEMYSAWNPISIHLDDSEKKKKQSSICLPKEHKYKLSPEKSIPKAPGN
jgi:hypothetical protein